MKVDVNDIRIPYYFSTPNPEKYATKLKKYRDGGTLSPIIIDENMNLVDGYISYLILKNEGHLWVEAYYDDEFPVIYIHGNHLHSDKQYTWYVPHKMSKKFSKKVKIGDTIKCKANNKSVPVIVREIFMRNEKDDKIAPVVSF